MLLSLITRGSSSITIQLLSRTCWFCHFGVYTFARMKKSFKINISSSFELLPFSNHLFSLIIFQMQMHSRFQKVSNAAVMQHVVVLAATATFLITVDTVKDNIIIKWPILEENVMVLQVRSCAVTKVLCLLESYVVCGQRFHPL